MDPTFIIIVGAAFVIAGFVKGSVGFGMPAMAIAVLGTVLGVREAIPLVAVPAILFNVFQAEIDAGLVPLIRRFWGLLLGVSVGIWSGTHFMAGFDPRLLSGILGVMLGTYAIISLRKVRFDLPQRSEAMLSPVVGGASGLFAGMTGTILVPLVLYLQAIRLTSDAFVRTMGLVLLVASVFWITALIQTGVLNMQNGLVSLGAMLPTAIGFAIGGWCRRRMSQERFRTWLMIGLIVMALNLLRKAVLPP